jgi:O-methyltransferase
MTGFRFGPKFPLINETRVVEVLEEWYAPEKIFGTPFLDLYQQSLDKTDSGINPFQAVNKVRRCHNLARLCSKTKNVSGDFGEAGVFRGSTARLVADIVQLGNFDMSNREMILFDSFEGLPDMGSEDLQPQELPEGEGTDPYYREAPRRFSNTDINSVAEIFKDESWVKLRKGWIPEAFEGFEDRNYSFVHIDVDLYQSTMDCLEYFVPRMNEGGIILCDDYLSLRFPGARMAWDLFCRERGVQFVTLDNYQSAIFF